MPQMSPYKWLSIFSLLLIIMALTMSFMYFFYFPSLKNSITFKSMNKWIWKW